MTFGQLNAVLKETGLSPEALAPIFAVGNMTVRRWLKQPSSRRVPKGHQWRIVESIYQLVLDGQLSTNSLAVQGILKSSTPTSFNALIKGMGVSDAVLTSEESHESKMMLLLSQIGGDDHHKAEVEGAEKKLTYFRKMGLEWQNRISVLHRILRSNQLSTIDKLVAYGALFYLITPFDLIPDHIPAIGLIDDFGVLGFAVAFYLQRFPELLKRN